MMPESHPPQNRKERAYVEFGPGIVALLLSGQPIPGNLLFSYEQRQWGELFRELEAADRRGAAYMRLRREEKMDEAQHEAIMEAKRALKKGAQLSPPGLWRPFVHVSTLLADLRPVPPDVVQGFVPGESVAVVSGTEGIGKSYIVLHMAVCVAGGIPWLGLPVDARGVLILDLENRPVRLRERLHSMAHVLEQEQALGDLPLNLHGLRTQYKLDGDEFIGELVYLIEQGDAGLVIMDSLADFVGKVDENDNTGMGQVALRLRTVVEDTGASIVLIHHVSKATAGKSSQTPRGASSLAGGVDIVTNAIRKGDVLMLEQTKNRHAEPMALRARMSFEDDRFTLERSEAQEPLSDPVTADIRDHIGDRAWHWSNELVKALSKQEIASKRTIHARLNAMATTGELETDPEQTVERQSYRLRLRRRNLWETSQ